ncbi:hypothetical protein [Pandoraea sp. NPDC087047]|uniref:hypothetical protein n=1 Tax=Pandoraea sp. NPDC087047 TaxID=3364390 RepID=UPI003823E8F9
MTENLSLLLAENYRRHESFRFETPSWTVDERLVDAFTDRYLAAKETASSLTSKADDALRNACLSAMNAIFDALDVQATQAPAQQFLVELRGEATRLLGEELDWYAKARRHDFIDAAGDAFVDQLTALQSRRHFIACLPASAVAEMNEIAQAALGGFRANAAAGKLRREDLSINGGPIVARIRRILNREFEKLGVLDAMSAYVGRKTRVVGLSLELSLPQAQWWRNTLEGLSRPPKTLYAHLDETISMPKSIVYLSDVGDDNGPTSCYPLAYEGMALNPLQEIIGRVVGIVGSSTSSMLHEYYGKSYHQSVGSERFREHFMKLPEIMRFNSHLGWDVMPDSALESRLAESEVRMTGPAGTFLVFDGARLLHRGGMVRSGERLALQVIISDLTLPQRVWRKLKRMVS